MKEIHLMTTWMSMASNSVPRIKLISSSICCAMPGFCLLWRLVFDLFPFYFNSHLMPWCHRRKEINHRHYLIIISPSAYFCLPKIFAVIPRSECCDPVLKENLRWELISYSELLWNLELTPPVIYCQTLNHQSQKAMISSSEEFYVFCGFPKYLKGKVFNWKCVCLVG